jgi:predicted nucleotidyltransferase
MERRQLFAAAIQYLRCQARLITPEPIALIVFGSCARGQARASSDLDVLAVRPADVAFSDDAWTEALADWCRSAATFTGLPVELIEADEDEVCGLLSRPGPTVWRRIADEGVVLTDRSLDEIAGAVLIG